METSTTLNTLKTLKKLIYPCLSLTQNEFFDRLMQRIDDHFITLDKYSTLNDIKNKNKSKGELFELICFNFIKLNVFKQINCLNVWLFKDLPDNLRQEFGLSYKDMGIDIIVQTVDNKWLAIQCKYRKKPTHKNTNGYPAKWKVNWKDLSTFYSLCQRTGIKDIGWNKHIVITTAESVNRQGLKNDKDISICLGTFRNIEKSKWLELIGDKGETLNGSSLNIDTKLNDKDTKLNDSPNIDELRSKRLKFLLGNSI